MKKLFLILILTPIFISGAFAENIGEQTKNVLEVDEIERALPEEGKEITGELRIDGGYDVRGALERLASEFVQSAVKGAREELRACCGIIAIAIAFNIALLISDGKGISGYMEICACAAAACILVRESDCAISEIAVILNQFSDFSKAALPVVFSSAALSGYTASAAAKYAAAVFAIDLMLSTAQKTIIPLVYAYIGVTLSCCLFSNPVLRGAAKLTKWLSVSIMSVMTAAFGAYISLTGIVAGSADAAAIKTAKTLISSVLPVVGSIAADSSAAILAAAALVRSSVGVFGLVGVCAICAGPFAVLSAKVLLIKAAGAAAEMMPNTRIARLVADISGAFVMMLGLLGCCGIMMFISIMAAIRTVSI